MENDPALSVGDDLKLTANSILNYYLLQTQESEAFQEFKKNVTGLVRELE